MRNIIVFSCLIWLFISEATAGGGWTKAKGSGFLKIAQNIIISDRFFNPEGNVIDITTVSLYTTSVYGEYGLTDRFTGILYAPVFVRSTLNAIEFRQSGTRIPGDFVNDIGDMNIGIKYGIIQNKPVVLAASLMLGLPTGETMGGDGEILQTGDGEFNQLLMLEASHSFYPAPFYASAGIGFNNRTNNFSDEYHISGEIGYTPSEKWLINMKFRSVQSFFNGSDEGSAGNGIFSNNTEFVSYTPEINYLFTKSAGLSASAGFALSGRRILASPNYSLGFFWNL